MPWGWRRPAAALRRLPWALTVVLAATALAAWIHAYRFTYYLPPGINGRLLKAAVWLTLAAVIVFYTAWLHHLRHRPYGRRSQLLLWLVAFASVYVVMERREAFRPRPGPGPRPTSFAGEQRPHLLVVGVDTASFDALLPLAEQGWLPFVSRLIEDGAWGRLRPLRPKRSMALWTSLVSGKHPYKHGILGPRRYAAPQITAGAWLRLLPSHVEFSDWGVWGATRATTAADREVLALWDILERLGVRTGVVGWPVSSPPPAVAAALSDRFFDQAGNDEATPPDLAERGRLFRPRLDEVAADLRADLGAEVDAALASALAGDLWREAIGGFLLETAGLDALLVQLPGLREVSAAYFGGYVAAQFDGIGGSEEQLARQSVATYYRHIDETLARLWEHMPSPRLLAVVSPHGVGAPGDAARAWHRSLGQQAIAGDLGGTPDGVFLLFGEGVRPGALPQVLELVDVVPTLLYGLGYPIASDFDGDVATAAFDEALLERRPLVFVPSYETFAAPRGPR